MILSNSTVLITGSNGFIGHHVCQYFSDKGCYVIGLGRSPKSKAIVDEYAQIDLDTDVIFEYKPSRKIDAIIHLAADMRADPHCVEVVQANCTGEQRLLEYCEKNEIKVLMQLSSLPVIGRPKEHPITENHPLCPKTVYHCTKVMEELLADFAYRNKGIRTASFRISAPVGSRMNEKTIFPTFVRSALKGDDIVLYGKGTREQNFIHVDDISQALYKGMMSEKCHGVYNLSSYTQISNVDLANAVIERLHSSSKITFSDNPDPLDDDIWDVDISKLKTDTGFEPQHSVEKMIDDVAHWYKEKGVN